MTILLPKSYRAAGVHCGIKRDSQREDLALVVSDVPAAAAGVYTTNLVCGAPVQLNRTRTPSDSIRAVVINSGVANACTGEQGLENARAMARLAATTCGAKEEQVLVMSTGVIGEQLPMDRIERGIAEAAGQLSDSPESLVRAARGLMTTDTVHKLQCRSCSLDGVDVRITGMAKGAAMIGPNMATMLAVIATDAALSPRDAQESLAAAVDNSFNCISVEGHMSTSDSVVLLANGAAGGPVLSGVAREQFQEHLDQLCQELARSIPGDGEGASHFITIEVCGCATQAHARRIAKTVANSPLVKTAIAGADPNWGRIVSAAGYAEVPFDPERVDLRLNGFLLYEKGAPAAFEASQVSASLRNRRETDIVLSFGEGSATARFWTTDLTAEYVRLNADYHT